MSGGWGDTHPSNGFDLKEAAMTVSVAPAVDRTAAVQAAAQPVLAVKNIEVIYNHVILVLRGLSLEVPQGKIIALLGSNGAGKSTTLKAVSGLLPTEHGDVTDGKIIFDGRDITHLDAAARVRMGMSLCMEGRRVFAPDRPGEPRRR